MTSIRVRQILLQFFSKRFVLFWKCPCSCRFLRSRPKQACRWSCSTDEERAGFEPLHGGASLGMCSLRQLHWITRTTGAACRLCRFQEPVFGRKIARALKAVSFCHLHSHLRMLHFNCVALRRLLFESLQWERLAGRMVTASAKPASRAGP